MELERLVAALAPEAVLGSPDPVEVRDLAYDTRAVRPGAAVLLRPRRARATATTSRSRRSRRARSCSSSSARVEPRGPAAGRALVASRDGDRGGRLLRRADARARGRRRHRHERQDDDRLPAARDSGGGGPPARLARDGREPDRGRGAAGRAHDARGDRPPANFPRDARRRRPERRAGGVVARLRAAPARPRPLRRARLHEPDAGPSRLPRDDGGLLRRETPALHAERRRRPRP